jgi:diadenosine tetraphosphate (Ap4A) HIT family hydrolase
LENCDLCKPSLYPIVWENKSFRVTLINDHQFPGYCRVESIGHIKEMTDMVLVQQNDCMSIVFKVESILRSFLQPEKINLSSLGNITPHVHWHIIPRYKNDSHYPLSIWSEKKREGKRELSTDEENELIRLLRYALNQ